MESNTPDTRPVIKLTLADIAKHAKPRCKNCYGKGFVTKVTHEPSVGGRPAEFKRDHPCGCALRQWAKKVRSGEEIIPTPAPPATP